MRLLTKMRRQWCVYWPPAGTDAHNRMKYGSPIELKVYWHDTTELFMDKTGQQQVAKSKVYVADQTAAGDPITIQEQGVLLLGPQKGLTRQGPLQFMDEDHQLNPFKNENAWEIRRRSDSPTLKPRSTKDFVIIVYL